MAININLAQLSTLNNQSILGQTNANNAIIQAALPDALSRSGVSPNQMNSNLDMNSNQILNLPPPASINSPARLVDVVSPAQIASVPPVGISGAVVGLLNANKTDSGNNIFNGNNTFNGTLTATGSVNLGASVSIPAANVSFTQTGTGAVLRTANAKFKDVFDARDFGVVADGVTDDQAAFNAATLAISIAGGGLLQLPPGTILVGNAITIYSNVHIKGTGRDSTIVKLKNATNLDVFVGQNAYTLFGTGNNGGIFDWGLQDLTIDGNSANNTNGNGLAVYGYRWNMENVNFQNCALNFIRSDWTGTSPLNGVNMEAHMKNVLGFTCGQHGFNFLGPHDSNFESIICVDASQSSNASFAGMYIGPSMNVRMVGYHGWHTGGAVNRTSAQFYTDGSGNDISSSGFEGSWISPCIIGIGAAFNNFASSNKYFSSWNGGPQIAVRGPQNTIRGSMQHFAGRPATSGIAIGFGSDNASFNDIELNSNGCLRGAVDWTFSAGNNRVKVIGFHTSGPGYISTPLNSDEAWITVTGGATTPNQLFKTVEQQLQVASNTSVPAGGTTGTGLAFSSASNLGVFFGSGAPTLSAAQGSLYIRTDGSSTSTRLYVNTNGSTTWTNVTTAT